MDRAERELADAEANMRKAEACQWQKHPAVDLDAATARLSAARGRLNTMRRQAARQAASAAGAVFEASGGGCPQPKA